MTYSKKPDEGLQSLFQKIADLEPGDTLKIGPVASVGSLRWKVYSWLRQTGLKEYFVVRTRGANIFVERKETEFKSVVISDERELPPKLETILKEMLKMEYSEALEYLGGTYATKRVNAEEFAAILQAYDRTQR